MLAAQVGKVNMMCHVCRYLRGSPILAVVGHARVAEVADIRRFQMPIHQGQFVARRKIPALNSIETIVDAQISSSASFGTGGEHVLSVLPASADRGSASTGNRATEAA